MPFAGYAGEHKKGLARDAGISRFLMSSRENPRCFRDSIWWSLIMSLSVYNLEMKNSFYWLIKHFDGETLDHIRSRFDRESGMLFLQRFLQRFRSPLTSTAFVMSQPPETG